MSSRRVTNQPEAPGLQVTSVCCFPHKHSSDLGWRDTLFSWLASLRSLGADDWLVVETWLRLCVYARGILPSHGGLMMVSQGTKEEQRGQDLIYKIHTFLLTGWQDDLVDKVTCHQA